MKPALLLLTALLFCAPSTALYAAETLLVEQGVPRAQIVIAQERPRMVTLAALEHRWRLAYPREIRDARD